MEEIAKEAQKLEKCDVSYCCLGTTRKDAGSAVKSSFFIEVTRKLSKKLTTTL